MQTVSQAWIAAQQQTLVPESFVEVSLTVGDPDAQAEAAVTSNGELYFSDAAAVTGSAEQSPEKYATLEQNIWSLDGTVVVLPDAPPYGDNGYIGTALSGSTSIFSASPALTIAFSQVVTGLIPGLTIRWSDVYEDWATAFTVTAYAGATQIGQLSVTNNESAVSVVSIPLQNYDRIVLTVSQWNKPNHRARVTQITLGVEQIYGKADLLSFDHTQFVDPLSAELPNAEIVFEVSNVDGKYNPDNPQGVEKYLMERQMITARCGYLLNGAVEWIPVGTFFMSAWECPQNGITASFTARDAQEYMSDLYSGTSTGTLLAIATAAFTQAGLPTLASGGPRWVIDSSLGSISAPSGVDLSQYTIKEVLQLCANAACCVLYQDRAGVFHLGPLASGSTDYPIDQFNSYSDSELSLSKQLRAVDINNGQYTLSVGDVGDTQQISNPLISSQQAPVVAQWVAAYLTNRRTLSGEFRADPRLDALDRIENTNSFSTSTVLVTEITYSYKGAFRGTYEGRAGA